VKHAGTLSERHGQYWGKNVKTTQAAPKKRGKKLREKRQAVAGKRRFDEKARAERFRLKQYFENLPLLAYNISLDGMIVDCNRLAVEALGYASKDELVGRLMLTTIYAPSSREKAKELFLKWAKTGTLRDEELQVITKQGKIIDVLLNIDTIYDERRQPLYSISTQLDITERKRMEEALRKDEKRFRHISSVISDIAYSCVKLPDGGYSIDWMMGAVERVTGYSVEEIKEQGCWRFLVVNEDLSLFEQWVTGLAPGSAGFCELRLRHKTGDTVWVESSAECIMETENPERLRLYGGLVDITERKRAEQVLRESEERYRKLFEEAMDGIALADADTGIVLDCNQALAALVGRNRTELIGRHQAILHPPASGESEFSPTFKLHLTTHEGQVLETQVITGASQIREVEIKANLLCLQGRKMLQGIFRDITERKRAEEELRRRAEELAVLQATVLDITGPHDLPVLLQTIVERAARLLSTPAGGMYLCDPEKQEARCVVSYNTPSDYTGTVLRYGEGAAGIVAQTGEPLVIDDYRTWQGRATVFEEERPFKAVLTVPMIWHGRVTGVIHVLDDAPSRRFTPADQELLTLFANHAAIAVENTRLLEQEKRHAEELARYSTSLERLVLERTGKLAESERRFRELANLLPQIVFEIDEQGNLLFANRMTFAAIGYTEDDLRIGLNAFHMLAREDHDRARKRMQRILSGEELRGDEYTVQRKDGSTFPALVNAAPIMRGNKPVGLRGIVIDITERKRAEQELRSARERLEHVITSNPAVIITGKPRADLSDYNVTYMSDRIVEMLGFEPQQFIGHPEFWDSRVHPDDLRRYPTEVPELWRKGHCTFEYRFLHKDGTYRWVREEAKVIRDAAGSPVEVIGYWTDATEQKRMEEALVRSQRLAAIGETAAIVGHDLRNPLAAIAGATYLLRKQAADKIDDNGREALRIIEGSIEHSDKVINDLLEYSSEIRLQTSTTDPRSVIDAALSLARVPENVRVANEVQAEPRIVMDADKIQRAFLNIIRNAVEAMPQGGTMTISSRRTDGKVEFRFEDTGLGMPRETLEKLWTPLFTTKARGMGFGLAITRRIVEAHGGTVTADSESSKGSTFTVKLPVKTETREVSGT